MQTAPALQKNAKPRYKAFVSYAWSADRELAPLLRAGLESFDAPLFGIPRSKVFCDQTDLEAEPRLWPRIQRAIQDSEYLILLASPAAAQSKWVAKELEEWLTTRDVSGLRIALTDGAAPWEPETNDFRWDAATALPIALKGRFAEEPKIVDLTGLKAAAAKSPLDHNNLALRTHLAEFAPLFGKTKREVTDALLHEARRRLRWAAYAVITLAILALAAGGAAFLAVRSQRETAKQRQVAEDRRQDAERQQKAAVEAGEVALARQLAAQAELLRVSQPEKIELASLLAIEAVRRARTPETDRALRDIGSLLAKTVASASAKGRVWRLAVSPDGRWFAAGGENKTTRIFDLATGKEAASISHKGWVWALQFRRDAKALLSASDDGTVVVAGLPGWKTMVTVREAHGIRTAAFSADGKYIATGGWGHDATVYQLPGGTQVSKWQHPESVFSLAFHPTGALLATGAADHKGRVFAVGGQRIGLPIDTAEKIMDIRFSPGGDLLATASADGSVQAFDAGTLREKWRYVSSGVASRLSFNPRGTRVAVASFDGIARVLNAAELGSEVSRLVHGGEVRGVAFSPDNLWVATASADKTVRVFDASSGREVRRIGMPGGAEDVDWDPSGRRLIAAASDGTVLVADVAQRMDLAWRPEINPAPPTVSGDGRWLLRPDSVGGLHVDAVETGAPIAGMSASDSMLASSFSNDGKTLGRVRGNSMVELVTVPEGRLVDRFRVANAGAVVAVTGDGGNAVIRGSFRGALLLVQQVDNPGKRRRVEVASDCKAVNGAAFNADGTRLAIACSDGTVRMFDAGSGSELWRVKFGQSAAAVTFSPDGSVMAAGSHDGTAVLFDSKTGSEQVRKRFPSAAIAVALSGEKWLAVGTEDRRIYVYDAMGQHAWTQMESLGDYVSLAFRGNDELVSAASTIDTVWLRRFQLQAGDLVKTACAPLSRNLTEEEFRSYLPGREWRTSCTGMHR